MKIYILNTGGTLGMVGVPLRPARTVFDLMQGVNVPKGIDLKHQDFHDIMDSTNMRHQDRLEIGKIIAKYYSNHDAFIILHGTDSLAETTSFLSMLFKTSLQKPIFVIGAQMTKDESGSEATMQIENTLRVAKSFKKRGVVGVFNICMGDILDGARLRKRRDSDFNAFYTPGIDPVSHAHPKIFFRTSLRYKDQKLLQKGLKLESSFEQQIATFKVSADTPPWVLGDLLDKERLKGAILECKGAGNIPDRPWEDKEKQYSWIDIIAMATKKGIHIGILSPFEDGRVNLERYEMGVKAKNAGAISLESLTPDMADIKFRQAIALYPDDPLKIQEFISTNFVNELLPGFEDEEE